MRNVSTIRLLLLTLITCLWLHLCSSQSSHLSYHNIDPEDLSYFLSSNARTWQNFLEEVTFPTLDHCTNVLCAPRQQNQFPFQWNGYGTRYGSVTPDIWRPPGLADPQSGPKNSPKDPRVLLEDIRQGIGPGSEFIYDETGRVIGILPGEEPEETEEAPRPSTDGPGDPPESRPDPPPYNVDICCQTREAFFINTTLTDVYGVTRTIAQYSVVGSYQFIRHGLCGSSGSCPGQCVPELITIPLAIHPNANNQLVTFSFFKIPGYCSCKVPYGLGR